MNYFKSLYRKSNLHKVFGVLLLFFGFGCKENNKKEAIVQNNIVIIPTPNLYFGIDLNEYVVKEFKIKR